MAAGGARLTGANPDKQASIAIHVYQECLMQLTKIPKGKPPKVARM